MFVSMSAPGADSEAAYNGALFLQQRVKSYLAVVDSPAVLEPVIDELQLQTTPAALAARVEAVGPPNTVLINVNVLDHDPEQAARIADAVARSFAQAIVRLEDPSGGGDSSPVKPTVTKPAVAPASPLSPRTTAVTGLGALLGLGLGICLALARDVLDTKVRSVDELIDASGTDLLGVLGLDEQAEHDPLITTRGQSELSEAYWRLRANLRIAEERESASCLVVTSANAGEGKTTVASNLAITVGQSGSRVVLVEADLRHPDLSGRLGIDGSVGMTDVLLERRTLDDAIVAWGDGLMDVLPAGPVQENPSGLLGSHRAVQLLATLRERYDVVILDAPAVLSVPDAAVLAKAADGALLVTRLNATRREDVARAAEAIRLAGGHLVGCVLAFVPTDRKGGRIPRVYATSAGSST